MLGVASAGAAVELILDDKARDLLVAAGPATAGAREEAREVDVGVAAAWLVVVLAAAARGVASGHGHGRAPCHGAEGPGFLRRDHRCPQRSIG